MVSVTTVLNKITKSPFLEKHLYKAAKENPAKFVARVAFLSALSKDLLSCYYYTTQSFNNKEIPEERRGFVGYLDLTNGASNIILQFTIARWIEKQTPIWLDKLFGEKLNENKATQIAKNVEDIIKAKKPKENILWEQIRNYLKKKKVLGIKGNKMNLLNMGFSALVMLVATQIICKRIFTPLIATPIAGQLKKRFLDKSGKKTEAKQEGKSEEIIEATYKPWLSAAAMGKSGSGKTPFNKLG